MAGQLGEGMVQELLQDLLGVVTHVGTRVDVTVECSSSNSWG